MQMPAHTGSRVSHEYVPNQEMIMVPAVPVYHPPMVPDHREFIQVQTIFGAIIAIVFNKEDDLELVSDEAVLNCIISKVIQLVFFSIGNDGKVCPATSIPTFQVKM